MRILLISVDFPPHRDGVSSVSHHYARGLAQQGHDVLVVAPKAAGAAVVDKEERFKTFRFAGYSLGWMRLLPFLAWSAVAFVRHRPSIVIPMNIGYGGGFALFACGVSRARYVCVAYAYEFLKFRRNTLARRFYNLIYRRSAFIIAISRFTQTALVAFGAPAAKLRLAYPGVASAGAMGRSAPGGNRVSGGAAPVIGTCGRLIHRKGMDRVIEAVVHLRDSFPGIRYRIAGDGPFRGSLGALASRLGVADHVVFLGKLSDAELQEFYKGLDLFVMPARDDTETGHVEGFGIVFLEAALHGVPSVGTGTGGIPEAVVDGVTGVIVPPSLPPDQLAQTMADLLRDPELLRRMGAAARDRALDEFNWETRMAPIVRWIEDAAEERSS